MQNVMIGIEKNRSAMEPIDIGFNVMIWISKLILQKNILIWKKSSIKNKKKEVSFCATEALLILEKMSLS